MICRAQLDACLEELEVNRAEAIRSAYVEGYFYQELATRFDTPLNTIRTWLRNCLEQTSTRLNHCLPRMQMTCWRLNTCLVVP